MRVGSAIPESIVVPKGTGAITVGAIDLLNHAHPPRRSNCGEYPARSAAATMMNPSASSSRNQFATGTSATLPVLEGNREMAKPQKMELLVVRRLRRGARDTKIAGA